MGYKGSRDISEIFVIQPFRVPEHLKVHIDISEEKRVRLESWARAIGIEHDYPWADILDVLLSLTKASALQLGRESVDESDMMRTMDFLPFIEPGGGLIEGGEFNGWRMWIARGDYALEDTGDEEI